MDNPEASNDVSPKTKLVLVDTKTMLLKKYEGREMVHEAQMNIDESPIEEIKSVIEEFRVL